MSWNFIVTVFSYVLITAQYPALHVTIFDIHTYLNVIVCLNPSIIELRLRECIDYHVLTDKTVFL